MLLLGDIVLTTSVNGWR